MKHTRKIIALTLSLALASLAVLTGCSSGTSSTAQTGSSSSAAGSASASTSQQAAQETVMGKVSYVGSDYISVTVYTGGEDVTDFTALDVSGLTESDETRSIDTTDTTEYLKAESGMLSAAAREDVATGAFIVSTCDENGTHQIILIESAAPATTDSTATDGIEAASGDSEQADSAQSASDEQESSSVSSEEAELAESDDAAQAE